MPIVELHLLKGFGTAAAGVRLIGRVEISGAKITRQDVWNDIAETKAQP